METSAANNEIENARSLSQITASAVADKISSRLHDGFEPHWKGALPCSISNLILDALREKKNLCAATLPVFSTEHFRISKVDLSNCVVTYESLRVFEQHPVSSLNLNGTQVTDQKILDVEKVLQNLFKEYHISAVRSLDLGGFRPISNLLYILSMDNLRCLSLSGCAQLTNRELYVIAKQMSSLTWLDISQTKITTIEPLKMMRKLNTLIMHRLSLYDDRRGIVETLESLNELQLLDCSIQKSDFPMDGEGAEASGCTSLAFIILDEFANRIEPCWPYLHSIDLSGWSQLGSSVDGSYKLLRQFIVLHPKLKHISLLDTPLETTVIGLPEREIVLYNSACRTNSLNSLSLYGGADREQLAGHALQAVYYVLQSSYEEFSDEDIAKCIKGVTTAMKTHQALAVQMAGTACLYHVCKQRRVRRIAPRQLYLVVERCLDAAEFYQNIVQMQKNVWLTICSDHLLQFDNLAFHRICAVALESMVKSRDPSVSRMTIAIVSIVAPKLRSVDTKMLIGSDPRYVTFFVKIINQHFEQTERTDNFSQYTLKFTLSALWNLTDECARTCALFLEVGGLEAAFRALIHYSDNSSVQTKVLGLLNNLAEVPSVQNALLDPTYLNHIIAHLESGFDEDIVVEGTDRRMDMSYFAAGILSNLLSTNTWEFEPTPKQINDQLVNVVRRWVSPKHTMVAYRSFVPFLALLSNDSLPGVQMWAVWAMHHVCLAEKTKTYSRDYAAMVRESGVDDVLWRLFESSGLPLCTRNLALEIVTMNGVKTRNIQSPSPDEHATVEAQ